MCHCRGFVEFLCVFTVILCVNVKIYSFLYLFVFGRF